jgi:phage-related protein
MKGKDGIARAIHVTASGRRVVVVPRFGKQSQKTPRREIASLPRRVMRCRPTAPARRDWSLP